MSIVNQLGESTRKELAMKTIRRLLLYMLLSSVIMTACTKDDPLSPDKSEPPALPPVESMKFDLSLFNNSGSLLAKANPSLILSKNNFANAVIRVAIVNTVVFAATAIPVATFAAAISQHATLESDGKFHWVYQVKYGKHTFEADLAGYVERDNSRVIWEMYISNNKSQPA